MSKHNLKPIGSLTAADEYCYPFALQSIDDFVIHRTKFSAEVVAFNNFSYNLENKLRLSAAQKTQKPTAYPQLSINSQKVFENCNLEEKNYLLLHPYLLPNCTLKNTHYVKCQCSPCSATSGYILACLLTSGMIELFTYNLDTDELRRMNINLSDQRRSMLKNPAKEITKLEALVTSYNDIAFGNFEWCPIPFEEFKLLITVSKSNEIIFFRIQDNQALQVYSKKVDSVISNQIKWMDLNDDHYLLVSTSTGKLVRYSVDLKDDGMVNEMDVFDEIQGECRMPMSNITVDYFEESTIVICCKTHTLEVFHFTENSAKIVLSKYLDLSITGIEICDNLEYLISTLNSRVYLLKLDLDGKGHLKLQKCDRLEITAPECDATATTNYAFYGIAASKNKALVYIACYPQIAFDHLVNKQPLHISVNLYSKNDPFELILNNPSLKLTDYSDCIEAIKHIGFTKLEPLKVFEMLDYIIELNDEFLYYLKIQLLAVDTKLDYYRTRSHGIYDITSKTKVAIKEIISVINNYCFLNHILKTGNKSELVAKSIRASANFLRSYCDKNIEEEPFKTASETLRTQLIEMVADAESKLLKMKKVDPEICLFCQEALDPYQSECRSNHKMNRCVVTNLLVPLDSNNYCKQCKESVTALETLILIVGNSNDTNFTLCPFCDMKFTFYE